MEGKGRPQAAGGLMFEALFSSTERERFTILSFVVTFRKWIDGLSAVVAVAQTDGIVGQLGTGNMELWCTGAASLSEL